MTRRLVFIAVFAVLAVAGLGARAADPVETFIRHAENPAQFDPADFDQAFRGEYYDGVRNLTFNRDQMITQALHVKAMLTDYQLVSLKILNRQTSGNITNVTYLARTKAKVHGAFYSVVYRVTARLRAGGPNGFVWLNQVTKQLHDNDRS